MVFDTWSNRALARFVHPAFVIKGFAASPTQQWEQMMMAFDNHERQLQLWQRRLRVTTLPAVATERLSVAISTVAQQCSAGNPRPPPPPPPSPPPPGLLALPPHPAPLAPPYPPARARRLSSRWVRGGGRAPPGACEIAGQPRGPRGGSCVNLFRVWAGRRGVAPARDGSFPIRGALWLPRRPCNRRGGGG